MNVLSESSTLIETLKKMDKGEIIKEVNTILDGNSPSKEIPKFYLSDSRSVKNLLVNSFASIMTDLANRESFNSILKFYPSQDDVQYLRDVYEEMSKNTHVRVMKYAQYKQLRQKWPEKLQQILSSRLFVEIGGHSMHTINVDELFKHLDMIPRCVIHFIRLNQYDLMKCGSIDERSFYDYIADMAGALHFIEERTEYQPNFRERYIDYVAQRILIVLDPLRTGKIFIHQLLQNPLYLSFVMLESSADDRNRNPFSPITVAKYISEFEAIDQDCDGFLVKQDLFRIKDTKYTKVFVDRVFESLTGTGSYDFAWYLRFRFAWDNLGTKWSNQIFFDVMDVNGDGKISLFEVNYFYREISRKIEEVYPEKQVPIFDYWANEQFDHLGASNASLTKDFFVNSRDIEQFVRQLTDFCTFSKDEFGEDSSPLE